MADTIPTTTSRTQGLDVAVRAWPPERDEVLRQLWADRSLSAAEIGRRLGVGKNAVIGRSHRLRLPGRASPIVRRSDKQKPRESLPAPSSVPLPVASTREPAPRVSLPLPEPIAAIERTGRLCCWPLGHPGTPGFAFCQQATRPGKPYCIEHCHRAYVGRRTASADEGSAA